jgi:hypothetical protein
MLPYDKKRQNSEEVAAHGPQFTINGKELWPQMNTLFGLSTPNNVRVI